MTTHEIMTTKEVAQYIRVSERTIYDWIKSDIIPCSKFGGMWRFHKSDIDDWMRRKQNSRNPYSVNQSEPAFSIDEDMVIITEGTNKTDVLDMLIDKLSERKEITNSAKFKQAIYEREELMSTGIGLGVGIPHVRIDSVKNMVVAAALCENAVHDYETLDDEPVRLVVMVAANTAQHADYLQFISKLSRKLKDDSFRAAINSCSSPKEVYQILTGE